MPKKDLHPKQHPVDVIMTDGTKFQILSTWGKEGQALHLDMDPKNHPAWQEKSRFVNLNNERVSEFNKKFGGGAFTIKKNNA